MILVLLTLIQQNCQHWQRGQHLKYFLEYSAGGWPSSFSFDFLDHHTYVEVGLFGQSTIRRVMHLNLLYLSKA